MVKIHTRQKRSKRLTSSFGHKFIFSGLIKKRGIKTFKTEESAKTYATKKGLKDAEYNLVPTKKGKKVKIEMI